VSTASKVLNDTGRASAETRARVLATADRLDFRPDALAQFFATGKSFTVGLLSRNQPAAFMMPVLIGAQSALGQRNLAALMYYSGEDASAHQENIRKLRARRVDGVLFVGNAPDHTYPSIGEELGKPVVYMYARSDHPDDLCLIPDGFMAGQLAAEHLIGLGRRHIAHITAGADIPAVVERLTGLRTTLAEHGLRLAGRQPMYGTWLREWGVEAAHRLLRRKGPLDAVFCGNDQIALGLYQELREAGVRIPDDIAIVGYDHWSRLHGARDTFLTTIDPNLPELGAAAVDRLLAAIDGNVVSGLEHTPCVLVPGESSLGPRSGGRRKLTRPAAP